MAFRIGFHNFSARTRNDHRLRGGVLLAYLLLVVVGFAWVHLSSALPATIQPYAVPALGILIVLPVYGFFMLRRADYANRSTDTDDEARVREARARILGGDQ
jgi:hypothetical protein